LRVNNSDVYNPLKAITVLLYRKTDQGLVEIDWLIKVLRNGCFHNGPVICPRLVIMAQGRLYWPEAIFEVIKHTS
jgi:hypothetical protein